MKVAAASQVADDSQEIVNVAADGEGPAGVWGVPDSEVGEGLEELLEGWGTSARSRTGENTPGGGVEVWMDGWVDGWMGGRMEEWMNG